MATNAAAARIWMSDGSAMLALLTEGTSDLQPQMMIAEAYDKMEDGHWMASLRAAFSALEEPQLATTN